jgi:hypothetical protein
VPLMGGGWQDAVLCCICVLRMHVLYCSVQTCIKYKAVSSINTRMLHACMHMVLRAVLLPHGAAKAPVVQLGSRVWCGLSESGVSVAQNHGVYTHQSVLWRALAATLPCWRLLAVRCHV